MGYQQSKLFGIFNLNIEIGKSIQGDIKMTGKLLKCLVLAGLCISWVEAQITTADNQNFPSPNREKGSPQNKTDLQKSFVKYEDGYHENGHIADEAEEMGIKVEKKEIEKRIALYNKLSPGGTLHREFARRQLLIEKYFDKQAVSEHEIKQEYDQLAALSPEGKQPSLESVKEVIKANILFKRDDVIQQSEKISDLRYIRNHDKMAVRYQDWPVAEIRLDGQNDECLAWLKSESICYVTLEEFNASLSINKYHQLVPLAEARIRALKEYISLKYAEQQARFSGFDSDADNIKEFMRKRTENLSLYKQTGLIGGRPVTDPEKLQETYRKYYKELFEARDDVDIQVIGSSDSLFVDSLHKVLTQWKRAKKAKKSNRASKVKEPVLPWITFKEADLPTELVAPTDTFYEGEFTPPIKTKYGFFICRLWEVIRKKTVPYKNVRSKLIYLATRDRYANMDSIMTAKTLAYYDKHEEELVTPDTAQLTAWLVPFQIEEKGNQIKHLLSKPRNKDTLTYAPLELSSISLPTNISRRLMLFKKEDSTRSFFGPLKGRYGQWYLKIKNYKKGGVPIPFARVKDDIRQKIVTPKIELDTFITAEQKDELLLSIGLGSSYVAKKLHKLKSMTHKDVKRLIESGELDVSGIPQNGDERDVYAFALHKLEEDMSKKLEQEEENFMLQVEIKYEKFHH